MSAAPFMQLYVGDYLADTLHLTTEQHGAYLLLLMTMWRAGAELPNDPSKLARICRVSPKRWPSVWAEIAEFFTVDGQVIRNHRLTKEHQKAVSISQERKTAASLGGKAKALKDKESRLANGSDLPCHSQISEPDIRKEDGGGGSAGVREAGPDPDHDPTFRECILSAMGIGLDGVVGPSRFVGGQGDMAEAARWLAMPGMTEEAVIDEVARLSAAKPDGPASSFRYFTPAMQRLSAALTAPPLHPAPAHPARASPEPKPERRRGIDFDLTKFDDYGNRIA